MNFNVYPNDDPDTAAAKAHRESRIRPVGPSEGKGRKKGKEKQKEEEEKPLHVFPTYKYSKPGLHEAVILDGLPFFIKFDSESGQIVTVEEITEPSRILKPPNREEYPYTPYEFANLAELLEYVERSKKETKYTLYQKGKSIIKKYNDQDEHKQILLATDLLWSYFQDKFGTTHYDVIVGDNDSGKSSIGNTFEAVAYRAVNMTSPTAPNIFRVLGTIEPAQCTLILDEADKIDDSPDIMNILKTGYDYNKRVTKTNTNTWKPEFFYTYCIKIIIAEKSPSRFKAKGLLDRALGFTVYPGEAELDIKEVTNPQGDPQLELALKELLDFRKLIPKHRKPRIDQIKQTLQNKEPVVLVSTQVIEAGVDLDFDIAVRDIGPIDSIVQTAGRCNRNGNRKDIDSPFFIYRIVDDRNNDYAKRVYGRVAIEISNTLLHNNSDVSALVKSYYEEVQRRRSSLLSDDINTAISELNYEKVEESFKLIDQEYKVPVFVEFDKDAINIWNKFVESSQPDARKLSRNEIIQQRHKMEQYMIGISEIDAHKSNLQETSGIYKINQVDIGILYDEITGFISR